jgi:hypothetical protein
MAEPTPSGGIISGGGEGGTRAGEPGAFAIRVDINIALKSKVAAR